MGVLTLILESLWFLLPAYAANMMPVLVKRLKLMDYPIDCYRTFRGKPIFGRNKTFRGFFFGIFGAILVTYLQFMLYNLVPFFNGISILNYNDLKVYALGFWLGFGALLGDAIESFFKRRIGIAPGKPWLPFDQMDYILGAMIFSLPIYSPPVKYYVPMILMSVLLHPVVNIIGYLLGLKKNKL